MIVEESAIMWLIGALIMMAVATGILLYDLWRWR